VRNLHCMSSFAVVVTVSTAFVHPGALESSEQLDFVAGKIASAEQPWANAFRDAKNRWADHQPHGGPTTISADSDGGCQDDATASYILSLAWKYSGDETYAQKAVAILNSWSNLQSITADNDQKKLVAGWIGADFGPAAELLRSYPGWNAADVASFQAMLKLVFYPLLNEASSWNGNVDLTQIDAMMSIAVFNEDHDEFTSALQRLELRMPSYFYLTSDGSLPPAIDGDGGNPQSFWSNPSKWIDGLTQETCRDNGHHAQFALGSALHACEVAWHQGEDIYSTYQDRLTSAMELMALQFNSGDMQGTCGGSPTSDRYDTWEIGYSHYHFISGVELPETRKLLEQSIRVQSERDVLNLVYETLTHADLDIPSASEAVHV
jgi:hypothetical protein